MRTFYVLYIFSLLVVNKLNAQESSGLIFGNHNGIVSTQINPTNILRSTHKWQLQIGGAAGFFQTNYGYVSSTNALELLNNRDALYIPEQNIDDPIQDFAVLFKHENNLSYGDLELDILGPGFLYKYDESLSVGVSFALRSNASVQKIPSVFNYHTVADLVLDSIYQMNPFNGSAGIWAEYNVHASKTIGKNAYGITASYLRNYGSAYLNNVSGFNISESGAEVIEAQTSGTMEFAVSDKESARQSIGSGLSFDIGWTSTMENGNTIGLSILDLGFMKSNGTAYIVRIDQESNIAVEDYENIESIDELIQQLETDMIPVESSSGFTTYLATALSAQYGHGITENFSAQFAWTHPLHFSKSQLRRPASLYGSFLYDKKHVAASLPLRLYDYKKLNVGLAVRLGYLTLGSDHIFGLLGSNEQFQGADFYVNLNMYPFWDRDDKAKSASDVKCFY